MTAHADRCPRCDTAGCPAMAVNAGRINHKSDFTGPACPACAAVEICYARPAIDWRARALGSEAKARRAALEAIVALDKTIACGPNAPCEFPVEQALIALIPLTGKRDANQNFAEMLAELNAAEAG
jgi:hypothetical protein